MRLYQLFPYMVLRFSILFESFLPSAAFYSDSFEFRMACIAIYEQSISTKRLAAIRRRRRLIKAHKDCYHLHITAKPVPQSYILCCKVFRFLTDLPCRQDPKQLRNSCSVHLVLPFCLDSSVEASVLRCLEELVYLDLGDLALSSVSLVQNGKSEFEGSCRE